jgi:tetratricopeptide (TPR) repeat protein
MACNYGDYGVAYHAGQRALALFNADEYICFVFEWERGVTYWESEGYFRLAYVAWALGEYAQSEEDFARCMAIRDASGEKRWKGMHLASYAQLVQTAGDYTRGEELAREGLRLSETCGDRLGTALGQLAVGGVLAAQGRYEPARRHLFISLETGRHTGRLDLVMRSLCELGRIDLAQGKPADARHRFEDALAAFEQTGVEHHNALAGVWLGLGWTALAESNLSEAQTKFRKTLGSRGRTAAQAMEGIAGLAEAAAQEGDVGQAVELLSLVVDHRFTAHAMRQRAEQRLCELGKELQPDVYAERVNVGRDRPLEDVLSELAAGVKEATGGL